MKKHEKTESCLSWLLLFCGSRWWVQHLADCCLVQAQSWQQPIRHLQPQMLKRQKSVFDQRQAIIPHFDGHMHASKVTIIAILCFPDSHIFQSKQQEGRENFQKQMYGFQLSKRDEALRIFKISLLHSGTWCQPHSLASGSIAIPCFVHHAVFCK